MNIASGANQQGTQEFREHLPTADAKGHRLWIYPRKPKGRFYNRRTYLSWFLLALMFAGPFIRIGGNPLLMFDVVERKFSILGQMFWPTDGFIFAVAMVIFFIMIAVFTAAFGRVWCGWLCPQTILMELVFRKIEYLIDGDYIEQKRLAKAPWTAGKIFKRVFKNGVFFALSFVIGNWLLMYVIGSDGWRKVVLDDPRNHLGGLGAMCMFSAIFFLIFARFREQACTFICPYGRFQSVLMDDNSLIVSYDHKRGEKRAHFKKSVPFDVRRTQGLGHCIDCGSCVDVCPTGIDIRNGLQMECVHCTACIDACDHVMTKLNLPRGLIRYASIKGIEKNQPFKVSGRLIGYCFVLLILGGLLSYLLLSRTDIQASMLRAPGSLYVPMQDGKIGNIYNLQIRNKTHNELPIALRAVEPAGATVSLAGADSVGPEQIARATAIVALGPEAIHGGKCNIAIGLYSGDKLIQTLKSNFLGPQQ